MDSISNTFLESFSSILNEIKKKYLFVRVILKTTNLKDRRLIRCQHVVHDVTHFVHNNVEIACCTSRTNNHSENRVSELLQPCQSNKKLNNPPKIPFLIHIGRRSVTFRHIRTPLKNAFLPKLFRHHRQSRGGVKVLSSLDQLLASPVHPLEIVLNVHFVGHNRRRVRFPVLAPHVPQDVGRNQTQPVKFLNFRISLAQVVPNDGVELLIQWLNLLPQTVHCGAKIGHFQLFPPGIAGVLEADSTGAVVHELD